MDEQCDYCGEWGEWDRMIPVGFTEVDGKTYPQIKVWCNRLWCEYKDASIEAWQALKDNL